MGRLEEIVETINGGALGGGGVGKFPLDGRQKAEGGRREAEDE